jgi:F-type H+-transporting ATPase subunit b
MLIDWFTVVAQAFNFLLLVWLMKRFLYQPILHAIDERERRIAAQIGAAQEQKAAAEKERRDFQLKNAAFDQQRDEMLGEEMAKAKAEGQRLIESARQEYNALHDRLRQALEEEQHDLSREITQRAQQEVFAIANQALAELADTRLEDAIIHAFIRRLQEMEDQERQGVAEAFRASGKQAMVRTAFPLTSTQQTAIKQALEEHLALSLPIEFETKPEQISGVELVMNGYKIAWSIAAYLAALEKSVAELLNGRPGPDTNPKPHPSEYGKAE